MSEENTQPEGDGFPYEIAATCYCIGMIHGGSDQQPAAMHETFLDSMEDIWPGLNRAVLSLALLSEMLTVVSAAMELKNKAANQGDSQN